MTRELVDIGVNLTHRSFDRDRDAVIARGIAAGVTTLVITGTSVPDSQRAAALARQRPAQSFATAGVHPHHAKDCDTHTIEALRVLAAEPARRRDRRVRPRLQPRLLAARRPGALVRGTARARRRGRATRVPARARRLRADARDPHASTVRGSSAGSSIASPARAPRSSAISRSIFTSASRAGSATSAVARASSMPPALSRSSA